MRVWSGVLLLCTGCAAVDTSPERDFSALASPERPLETLYRAVERQPGARAGNALAAEVLRALALRGAVGQTNRATVAQARRIFQRVLAASHFRSEDWKLIVLQNDKPGLFTTGGTYLFVHSGLVEQFRDDAVAAAFAHALGHLAANHGGHIRHAHQLTRQLAQSTSGAPFQTISFTPKQEQEADIMGQLYTALAGYDPRSAHTLWSSGQTPEESSPLVQLHPVSPARLKLLQQQGQNLLGYYSPNQRNPDYETVLRRHARNWRPAGVPQDDDLFRKVGIEETFEDAKSARDKEDRIRLARHLDDERSAVSRALTIYRASVISTHELKVSYVWKGSYRLANFRLRAETDGGTAGTGNSGGPIEPDGSYSLTLKFPRALFGFADIGRDLTPTYIARHFQLSVVEVRR